MTSTLSLRDALHLALRPFDPDQARQDFSGSAPPTLALIPPQAFLQLAPPIPERIDSAGRSARIDACLTAGRPLTDLPELTLSEHEHEPGTWSVEDHDGRHRALSLLPRAALLPVILRVDPDSPTQALTPQVLQRIWSQYADEDDFDDPDDCAQRQYTPGELGLTLVPMEELRGVIIP